MGIFFDVRDCGQDATCVLCVECFTASEHKKHRYKMSTSEGGGYCDCGDPEAFRNYPHCSKHQPKLNAPTPEEVLKNFPEGDKDYFNENIFYSWYYLIFTGSVSYLYTYIQYCLSKTMKMRYWKQSIQE